MENKNNVVEALSMVLQFGINMLVPIGMCVAFGVWIGNKYDMNWIVVPLFFVGALAGITNIYKMVQKFIKQDTKKERDAKKNK